MMAFVMAYGSSLAKQAGATPTVDELGRMTQSSLQSKPTTPATLSHWTFAPLTLTKPPVPAKVSSMSRSVLKQDVVMESDSNVKLPEFMASKATEFQSKTTLSNPNPNG